MSDGPVHVLLADDDAMVRRGLSLLLDGVDGIEVVAEASDGDEVPDQVARHRPEVVLMDLRMHRVDGIRATAAVTALPDPPAVIVMTSFDTEREVVGALRAGAAGYLLKDAGPEQIRAAIHGAAGSGSSLSPAVLGQLLRLADGRSAPATTRDGARRRLEILTDSEIAVARAVADGHTNAAIAARLHLAPATVKAYVSRAMAKLHIDGNRVQLALAVIEAGSRETEEWHGS